MSETIQCQIEGGPSAGEIWDAAKYWNHIPPLNLVWFNLRMRSPENGSFCGPVTITARSWEIRGAKWGEGEDAEWILFSGKCTITFPDADDRRDYLCTFENAKYNANLGDGSINLCIS